LLPALDKVEHLWYTISGGVNMPAKNPRVNIVLDPLLYAALGKMAERDGVSMSLEARDLIKEALEAKEDIYWDIVAADRARTYNGKKAVSHKDIWGK
jgi:hypothetical protein